MSHLLTLMLGLAHNALNIVLRIKKVSIAQLPIFKDMQDIRLKQMLLLLLLEAVLMLKIGYLILRLLQLLTHHAVDVWFIQDFMLLIKVFLA
jgi:hypothetical protein